MLQYGLIGEGVRPLMIFVANGVNHTKAKVIRAPDPQFIEFLRPYAASVVESALALQLDIERAIDRSPMMGCESIRARKIERLDFP